jgi:AcrR family transcriptional regulator
MPSRSSVPKRPWRGPRSQEERSAATRAKVVTAATECLAELGLRAATLAAIADRAGVTCGAIQHQFGEKEALLDAVLEAAIEELRTHFSRVRASTPDPVGRVRALMARCREVLAGPLYRAFFEIQLSRRRESGKQTEAWSDYIDGELAAVWSGLFGGLGLSERQLEDAQRFLFAALNGIAAEGMLFPSKAFVNRDVEILEKTLLRLLELDR